MPTIKEPISLYSVLEFLDYFSVNRVNDFTFFQGRDYL